MFPKLFQYGDFFLPTYGVLVALAFLAGLWVTTRLARQAEMKSAIYKREEKLRESIVHLLSQELAGPLEGIIGAASTMLHDYASLKPETVLAKMHQISESAQRLDKLAKSLS